MTDTYEVELKVRAAHEPIRERLRARGVERTRLVRQIDTYYDAPDRDFAATDEALRIRSETVFTPDATLTDLGTTRDGEPDDPPTTDAVTRLTYKGPLVDETDKTRREAETTVGDAEEARAILEGLGYEPAATVEKRRAYYRVGEYTVTLDAVTGLGEFVEIDREVSHEALDTARSEARDHLRDLGLDPTTNVTTSYLGLLLDSSE